jgi:predicted thioredoxin/glutaredoxin
MSKWTYFLRIRHTTPCASNRCLLAYSIELSLFILDARNADCNTNVRVSHPQWFCFWLGFMVFNVTFNNISAISWQSVLLVEETGIPEEIHRPVVSHWHTANFSIGFVDWTNKTDCHDIAEILLKVTLNTIKPNQKQNHCNSSK